MRPRKVVTAEECERFNSLRKLYGIQTLTYNEVVSLLKKEVGWRHASFVSKAIRTLFIKVKRGTYTFPKEPVYIGKLENIMKEVQDSRSKIDKDRVKDSINFLKSKGFIVIKRTFDVDNALKHPENPVKDFLTEIEF